MQRYRCTGCFTTSSRARFTLKYRLKKRRKISFVAELLCSGVSQRRAARIAGINRKTVARYLQIESLDAEFRMRKENLRAPEAKVVEFDDLETFEHTKCKPVSVTLAVEEGSRRILGLAVSRMAANGRLAGKSKKLYGKRRDERREGRDTLFRRLKPLVCPNVVFKSDENPHYPASLKLHYPESSHLRFKGVRGMTTAQGELKKQGFDPIFSLNHTCAMLRANLSRLIRKTWCTTKCIHRLYAHLVLYAEYHNRHLPHPSRA